jgi:CobQ-like glutamine amidotransferase family enzyme
MDDFQLLEDYFNHMVGKKIIGVGVIDEELVFKLDDGSQVTIFSDLDNDLSMNLAYTN